MPFLTKLVCNLLLNPGEQVVLYLVFLVFLVVEHIVQDRVHLEM
jgi:hypothetical protein